jgi:hypothetical protein
VKLREGMRGLAPWRMERGSAPVPVGRDTMSCDNGRFGSVVAGAYHGSHYLSYTRSLRVLRGAQSGPTFLTLFKAVIIPVGIT